MFIHIEVCKFLLYTLKKCKNSVHNHLILKTDSWVSLVAQQLRIRLPMQGTRVQALVREDPTCRRATTEPAL